MPHPHVNNFYLIWFTWFDPIVIALTCASCIFTPAAALEMLVPAEVSPLIPEQVALVYQTAPLFGFMGIIFAVLLRASSDPRVWRIVQGATLMVDISLIAVMLVGLDSQGRLAMEKWRGIEWFNIAFTAVIAIGRVAYLTGVGGSDEGEAKKRI